MYMDGLRDMEVKGTLFIATGSGSSDFSLMLRQMMSLASRIHMRLSPISKIVYASQCWINAQYVMRSNKEQRLRKKSSSKRFATPSRSPTGEV